MRFYPRMSVEEYRSECERDEQRTKEALANFHKREKPYKVPMPHWLQWLVGRIYWLRWFGL